MAEDSVDIVDGFESRSRIVTSDPTFVDRLSNTEKLADQSGATEQAFGILEKMEFGDQGESATFDAGLLIRERVLGERKIDTDSESQNAVDHPVESAALPSEEDSMDQYFMELAGEQQEEASHDAIHLSAAAALGLLGLQSVRNHQSKSGENEKQIRRR